VKDLYRASKVWSSVGENVSVVDPRELSDEDGIYLVRLARKAIETFVTEGRVLEEPSDAPQHLRRKGMAFVTIEKLVGNERELRGCIGFLKPVYSLLKTVISAAIAAASEDPRFPPLSRAELDSIVIEVSVLSLPRKVSDPLREISIGRHGIIVTRGLYSGTLLPQVPVEYCWDVETFLAEGCLKAGMEPDCWMDPNTSIEIYEGVVFQELEPRGRIVRRNLEEEYSKRCVSRA